MDRDGDVGVGDKLDESMETAAKPRRAIETRWSTPGWSAVVGEERLGA
jgi:hypothetical protein